MNNTTGMKILAVGAAGLVAYYIWAGCSSFVSLATVIAR